MFLQNHTMTPPLHFYIPYILSELLCEGKEFAAIPLFIDCLLIDP